MLVTGGAGFIGSNLVHGLLERGDDVRVLDNFSTGSRANLDGLDVEIVEGELRSYERVHNAVRGVDVVYHLGALGSVPRSVQDPLTSSAVNVEGTLNVLLAARDEAVRRVVFSSSTSVYGSTGSCRPRRTLRPTRSRRTAWRSSRRSGTASASPASTSRSSRSCFGTSTSSGRARARSRSTPPSFRRFVTAIDAGDAIEIHGDGEQSRDFTYVGNVVDATIRAADADGASGEIFNVAAGSPASVNHIADTIGEILGKPVERLQLPPRAGDIRDSWADLSKSKRVLGYTPETTLEEGLRRTVEFLLG